MDSFNHDDNDLSNALGELRPLAPKINRDRMLFKAGRASKPKSRIGRILPVITIALALGLIQRETQVAWERGQRLRLEAKLAALEDPAKLAPAVVEPSRNIVAVSRELAPSSYGAISLRLRSGDGDDPWMEEGSNPDMAQPRVIPTEPPSPPLRVLDSRRPFSL